MATTILPGLFWRTLRFGWGLALTSYSLMWNAMIVALGITTTMLVLGASLWVTEKTNFPIAIKSWRNISKFRWTKSTAIVDILPNCFFHENAFLCNNVHCKSFCAKSGHSVGRFESGYLILCALHLARPLSECVIGIGQISSYHYQCFTYSNEIVKWCMGSTQDYGLNTFVCSLVIMFVNTTLSL